MTVGRARGQHAGLTREAVLETAVALVDAHGLPALSMRRLGAELGVEAMALYHHVGSKDELLDGLVERLFTQIVPVVDEQGPWQDAVRAAAHTMLVTLLEHPNLVPVVLSRPAITPGTLHVMERSLSALRAAGLTPRRSLDLMYAVIGAVVGHVATGGDASDGSDRVRLLTAFDLTAYPLLTAATQTVDEPSHSTFETTLEAVIAWFEQG